MSTTICTLLYGDHPRLAARLLSSLEHRAIKQLPVRIGLNEPSPQVLEIVRTFYDAQADRRVDFVHSPVNRFKYPVMRDLIHGTAKLEPIMSDYVMWFDDDSWLFSTAPANWLSRVESAMMQSDMIGSLWIKDLEPEQIAFFREQSWYCKRPIHHRARFITGGWWTIRTKILQKHDWPATDIIHNGGDVALGVLCDQQGYSLGVFTDSLGINADDTGRCSSAKRRGASQPAYGTRRWQELRHAQLSAARHSAI